MSNTFSDWLVELRSLGYDMDKLNYKHALRAFLRGDLPIEFMETQP